MALTANQIAAVTACGVQALVDPPAGVACLAAVGIFYGGKLVASEIINFINEQLGFFAAADPPLPIAMNFLHPCCTARGLATGWSPGKAIDLLGFQ